MIKSVDLEVAQATLGELIAGLKPNEEVVIMKDHKPVARLVPSSATSSPRQPGLMKGKCIVVAEDNEHLDGFREYMQ